MIEVVNITPNPTSNWVNIDFFAPSNDNYTITVMNVVGQELLRQQSTLDTGNYRERFDLSGFDNGIYLITISNASGSSVHKIVKQ